MTEVLSLWRGAVRQPRQVATLVMAKEIAAQVAEAHGLTYEQLIARDRRSERVQARWSAMAAIHSTGRYSLPRIGIALGGMDHTTVIHGLRRHAERLREGV